MKRTLLTVIALALLLLPRPAVAQGFISPFFGWNFGGDATCLEVLGCDNNTTNFGVGIGAMGPILGFEQEFAYSKDFFGSAPGLSSNVLTVMSNVMIIPKIPVVRPYVLGGVGLIKSHVDTGVSEVLNTGNNSFGWDLGGGVIIGSQHVGVRGDVRYFKTFNDLDIAGFNLLPGVKLDFSRASVALFLGF